VVLIDFSGDVQPSLKNSPYIIVVRKSASTCRELKRNADVAEHLLGPFNARHLDSAVRSGDDGNISSQGGNTLPQSFRDPR
jgi:hypothetical protein